MFEPAPSGFATALHAGQRRRDSARKAAAFVLGLLSVLVGWVALQSYRASIAPLPGRIGLGGRCEIWFVGSSTFGRWSTLERDLSPWHAVNRGVNGARIGQLVRRFAHDRPGPPPAALVFYAGENDIAFGMSADETFATLSRFVQEKRRLLGATPLILLSLKLAPTRVMDRAAHDRFDGQARSLVAGSPDLRWLNIGPLTLRDGRPGPFFVQDGIHLNAVGYRIWRTALQQGLRAQLPASIVNRCMASRA